MKDFVKVMKALSDPNRAKILKMLQHKTMCVCEMQAALQIAQPSVSKHLRILEEADLVGTLVENFGYIFKLTIADHMYQTAQEHKC